MPVGQFVQYSQARGSVNPGRFSFFIFVEILNVDSVPENNINPMTFGPSVQYQHAPGTGNLGTFIDFWIPSDC